MSGLDDTSYTTVAVTATPYTALSSDYMILVNINGASVVNLPTATAANQGRVYVVKQVVSAGAAVTVKTVTSTIDGTAGATGVLVKAANANGCLHLLSDGTNWQIICVQ
jgi:hypothetical protein